MHQFLCNITSGRQNKDAKNWEQRYHSFQSLPMKILEKVQNNIESVDSYILPTLMFKNCINHFPFHFFDFKVSSILFLQFLKWGISS